MTQRERERENIFISSLLLETTYLCSNLDSIFGVYKYERVCTCGYTHIQMCAHVDHMSVLDVFPLKNLHVIKIYLYMQLFVVMWSLGQSLETYRHG